MWSKFWRNLVSRVPDFEIFLLLFLIQAFVIFSRELTQGRIHVDARLTSLFQPWMLFGDKRELLCMSNGEEKDSDLFLRQYSYIHQQQHRQYRELKFLSSSSLLL
jgi:hypothetical protein